MRALRFEDEDHIEFIERAMMLRVWFNEILRFDLDLGIIYLTTSLDPCQRHGAHVCTDAVFGAVLRFLDHP